MPAKDWQDQVLAAASPRSLVRGATGLLVQYPSSEVAKQILVRCEAMIRGQVQEPGQKRGQLSDANYLDLLRVVQLAMVRGKIPPSEVSTLSQQILREYPTRDDDES